MKAGIGKGMRSVLLALTLLLSAASQAWAAEPATLEILAPEKANLGDQVAVTVLLRDQNGGPIRNVTIVFWTPASFLSTDGTIELGRSTTDGQGKAVFSYEARQQGPVTLNASFPGNDSYQGVQGSVQLAVEGSTQLYQSTAGIRVPGLGVWLLAAVLGVVWTIYLTVMVFLTLIAKEGPKPLPAPGGHHG